jgi:hypothetical protein
VLAAPQSQTLGFEPPQTVPLNENIYLFAYPSSRLLVTFTLLSGPGILSKGVITPLALFRVKPYLGSFSFIFRMWIRLRD